MTTVGYPYATGDLLERRNTYFYTPFGGRDFLQAWRHQRAAFLVASDESQRVAEATDDSAPIVRSLQRLKEALRLAAFSADSRLQLDRVLQRFEVSKRLHDDYTEFWRPLDSTRYHGLERYLLLAEVLGRAALLTHDLRYLNGLLKCVDILTSTSMARVIHQSSWARLRTIVEQEQDLVDRLAASAQEKPDGALPFVPLERRATPIILRGIVLVAAPTVRSQAYIQALASGGLHPEWVLLLGDHAPADSSVAAARPKRWKGISLVNSDEPVLATCRRTGIPAQTVKGSSINDAAALEVIRQLGPHTLIYSGAGGQIVSREALGIGARFLHMHAGYIPDYRGSTTIYYALLNGDLPAVTAIFLDAQIDTGGILDRRSYPVPDRSIDIDRTYDSSIRADALVRLLQDYAVTGAFAVPKPQKRDEGATYFVIHPVLKHLAILRALRQENG